MDFGSGFKDRISKLNESVADAVGPKPENMIENEILRFWQGRGGTDEDGLRGTLENGSFEEAEKEIQEFLEDMQQQFESKLSAKVSSSISAEKAEQVEMEQVKELLFYEIVDWDRKRLEAQDNMLLKGDTRNLYMQRGNHMEATEGKKIEIDGSHASNSADNQQSKFVSLEWLEEKLIPKFEHRLKQYEFAIKIAEDFSIPEPEEEQAKEEEKMMEERVNALNQVARNLEKGNKQKAKQTYEQLIERIKQEEKS